MPRSAARSRSNSRMCACVVTSRPVVGSSSSRASGSPASAIAIAARCCCPPLSSWGNRSSIASGSGRRTCPSSSAARARRPSGGSAACSRRASSICRPTRSVGVSDCPEFCGISASLPPRTRSSSRRDLANMSSPRNSAAPPVRTSPRLRYPIAASARVDLPEPLSPTRPTLSPGPTDTSTPRSTGSISPERLAKPTERPRTSISASLMPAPSAPGQGPATWRARRRSG